MRHHRSHLPPNSSKNLSKKVNILNNGGGGHSSSLLTLLCYFRCFREYFLANARLFIITKQCNYCSNLLSSIIIVRVPRTQNNLRFILKGISCYCKCKEAIYKRTTNSLNLNDFFKLSQLTNITLIITFLYFFKLPYNLLIFISLIKTNNSTLKSKPFNQSSISIHSKTLNDFISFNYFKSIPITIYKLTTLKSKLFNKLFNTLINTKHSLSFKLKTLLYILFLIKDSIRGFFSPFMNPLLDSFNLLKRIQTKTLMF
ncbi:hypothetical protein B6S12_01560 [Helicobacter valdiviensis]|uniref:Uncharacterized protein n=1 Tax=Helicobacter valdiviensis TaxID=1458358 RepID=A0A2W6NMU4_9HELI|nr:hypothetical protein B6S12_01560 [Helicobacter valdiviensis]